MTRENPLGLNDGYAELERLQVLHTGTIDDVIASGRALGRRGEGRADEVSCVNLDLVAPFGSHLAKSHLSGLEHDFVLHGAEADRNTRGVGHGMGVDAKEIRWVYTSSCAQNKLEGVVCIQLEAGDLGGRVCHGRRDGSDALTVTIEVEGAKLCGSKLQTRPLKSNRCLCHIAKLREDEDVLE